MARQPVVCAIGLGLVVGLMIPGMSAAAPQAPVRVGGNIKEPHKIQDIPPVYPAIAQQAGIEGTVIIEATIDREGNVSDARVLRSVPLFDQAAVAAVRQWKYEPTMLNGAPVPVLMTVVVNFQLKPGGFAAVTGPEAEWSQRLAAAPADVDAMLQLVRIYRESGRLGDVEQMLQRALDQVRADKAAQAAGGIQAAGPDLSQPVRMGDLIKEPRKIKDVPPIYPADAKDAKVGGSVILDAIIAKDGSVRAVRVLRSAPMFDQAAIDAVKQWVYDPTTINGVPVEVRMTVTVNFVLK